jgi:hypothetical protein
VNPSTVRVWVELVLVQREPSAEVDRVGVQPDPVAFDHVAVREIDGPLQGILGHGRVQHERREVVDAQLEPAEEARAVRIEPELAAGQIREIASADPRRRSSPRA